jgi:hypothetical protein
MSLHKAWPVTGRTMAARGWTKAFYRISLHVAKRGTKGAAALRPSAFEGPADGLRKGIQAVGLL